MEAGLLMVMAEVPSSQSPGPNDYFALSSRSQTREGRGRAARAHPDVAEIGLGQAKGLEKRGVSVGRRKQRLGSCRLFLLAAE